MTYLFSIRIYWNVATKGVDLAIDLGKYFVDQNKEHITGKG